MATIDVMKLDPDPPYFGSTSIPINCNVIQDYTVCTISCIQISILTGLSFLKVDQACDLLVNGICWYSGKLKGLSCLTIISSIHLIVTSQEYGQLTPFLKTASINESGISDFSSIALESGAI